MLVPPIPSQKQVPEADGFRFWGRRMAATSLARAAVQPGNSRIFWFLETGPKCNRVNNRLGIFFGWAVGRRHSYNYRATSENLRDFPWLVYQSPGGRTNYLSSIFLHSAGCIHEGTKEKEAAMPWLSSHHAAWAVWDIYQWRSTSPGSYFHLGWKVLVTSVCLLTSLWNWSAWVFAVRTPWVWFPAHWAPVVLQQLQRKEDSYRAENTSWMDQEEAFADILKQSVC